MYSEDTAKTKWCPFARIDSGMEHYPAINRGSSKDDWTYCIGSACMAWRWTPLQRGQYQETIDGVHVQNPGAEGRCGLAGEP